jgi:heptosyltransferase-1
MNSAISGLAAAFPDARIDLVTPAAFTEVMSNNKRLNKIIPIAKREFIYKPWMLAAVISSIRKNQYDVAIDCSDVNSHSATEAIYTLISGAKITAGWEISSKGVFDIEVQKYSDNVHATEMYLRLLSSVFGRQLDGGPYFEMDLPKHAPAGNGVGINCGGRGSKRWPLKNFVTLGSMLSRRGLEVDFIVGPDERGLRSILLRNLPDKCRLLPEMPLAKLMDVIGAFRVFVSSDTGPMHVAWCLGVPTIAVFTDSEIEKFRPLSPGSVAISAESDVPAESVLAHVLEAYALGEVPA